MPEVVSNPGETIRLGWKDAKLVPSSWSVYERVLVGDPRKAMLTLRKIFLFILFLGKSLSVSVGECR